MPIMRIMPLARPKWRCFRPALLQRMDAADIPSPLSFITLRLPARMRCGILIAIAALLAGCASIPARQAGQSAAVAPALHLTDVTPPKLVLPDWQLPQVDLSLLNPDRKPSNDRDW